MTIVKCGTEDCKHLEKGVCTAKEIQLEDKLTVSNMSWDAVCMSWEWDGRTER